MKELWMKVILAVFAILLSLVVISGREIDSNHESRISVLESQWIQIDRRLEKIDAKLDRLLQVK